MPGRQEGALRPYAAGSICLPANVPVNRDLDYCAKTRSPVREMA